MHYLVQDVIFISLVLMGFLAIFQGAQFLMRWIDKHRKEPRARHEVNNQP